MRFVRRTVAPLLTGALAAGALVAAAQADVLPISGVLAQATDSGTTDTTVPADQLDLDELIAHGTDFDFESVFVDLGPVGDFSGIYQYGNAQVSENVAQELQLVAPGVEDPDGDGPVVAERTAADRFLLSEQCNGLVALAIRKQVSQPVLARIVRPDEAAIAASQPSEDEEGAQPAATVASTEADPLGTRHILPLESVVEVGRVTVSVLDLDLIRARPAALLSEFVGGEPALGEVSGGSVTPDAVGSREFFEALWRSCLAEAAQEGTVPAAQTLNGRQVFTLKRDDASDLTSTGVTPDVDTATWLEAGLEIRVETTFLNVDDNIVVNPQLDLDTKTWLEHFADSVEPATEIAARLVARSVNELDLLEREAFTPISGFEYGDEIAGTKEAAAGTIRRAEVALAAELAESTADRILHAGARLVFRPGANATNVRRRLSEPPNGFFVSPVAAVQMIAWDPEFLNSDAFRRGWKKGLVEASNTAADLEDLVEQGTLDVERVAALRAAGVVDLVVSAAEGRFRTDYLLPCYSVTVSSDERGRDFAIADLVIGAQKQQRDEVFGFPSASFLTGEPDQRAEADADRAGFCSSSNFREYLSGLPVEDLDDDGIADELAENDDF